MLLHLLACHSQTGPEPFLSPDHGPQSGGYTVDVPWGGGGALADVTLGGVTAWVVETRTDGFTVLVQGAPDPGPADLRFTADGVEVTTAGAFTYDEPVHPAFARMVGYGASIGAGVQSGGLTATMAHQSSLRLLAEAGGAFFALPEIVEGLFPPLPTTAVGPGCDLPGYDDHVTDSFFDALAAMRDEEGDVDWALGRKDADVEVRNLAIPGAGLSEQAWGPAASDVGGLFFAHLLHEPEGDLDDPPARSQLQHAIGLEPTMVVGVDLLGNDLLDALLTDGALDTSLVRPAEELRPALREILAGLAGTGAVVFLADMPRPTALPLARDAAQRSLAEGWSQAEVDAALAEIDAAAVTYTGMLVEEAAAYDNVVIVPLAAEVEALAAEGLEVDGQRLTTAPLGGLVGLDGIHFSATGNAVLANVLADAVDAELGTDLPRIDLAAVLAVDPASPAALEAAGVDRADCEPAR